LDQIAQLDESIGALVRVLTIDERRFSSGLEVPRLNLIDLEVLSFLHRAPGSTAKEIAVYLGVRPTTMQSVVDRLNKTGLLQRDKDVFKGRSIALSLTTDGLILRQRMHAQNLENCRQMLQALGEQEGADFVKSMAVIAATFV
jgi:DNA-binding MarR family transcriptional regulator